MTFSIIAKSEEALGVGVVSGSTAVRKRVPWVKSKVGAIATQGYTKTRYGRKGLRLLEEGVEPKSALENLLQEDSSPERKQVAIIDSSGRMAVHTGSSRPRKRCSKTREKYIALGNLLKSEKTISAMAEAFGKGKGNSPPGSLKLSRLGRKLKVIEEEIAQLRFW